MLDWYGIVYWISFSSYLIPIFLLAFLKSKFKTERDLLSVLFVYLTLSVLTEIINLVFIDLFKNNNPVIHFYTLFAFLILTYFYKLLLKDKVFDKMFKPTVFLFCVCSIIYSIYIKGLMNVNVISYLTFAIFMIFNSAYYFYKVYTEMKVSNLFQDGLFWINSAFLIYFSSTFYVSLFEDVIKSVDLNLFYYTWPIQLVSTIIFNIILSKGIWLMRKQ
jgi:hypothetical protein